VIIENGVMVQIFQDGMLTFHDLQDQRLLRVLIQHSDSINDLVIKDYDSGEGQVSFVTCSKDNTLRLWSTHLNDRKTSSHYPVDGDLKRIVYLDH
jgi:WD40 repeat protein